jgi:hypothetical protein
MYSCNSCQQQMCARAHSCHCTTNNHLLASVQRTLKKSGPGAACEARCATSSCNTKATMRTTKTMRTKILLLKPHMHTDSSGTKHEPQRRS